MESLHWDSTDGTAWILLHMVSFIVVQDKPQFASSGRSSLQSLASPSFHDVHSLKNPGALLNSKILNAQPGVLSFWGSGSTCNSILLHTSTDLTQGAWWSCPCIAGTFSCVWNLSFSAPSSLFHKAACDKISFCSRNWNNTSANSISCTWLQLQSSEPENKVRENQAKWPLIGTYNHRL